MDEKFKVTFHQPKRLAAGSAPHPQPLPPKAPDPFYDEIERFAAADPRWRSSIEFAAGGLSGSARQTLGVCLAGFLEVGPMPRLIPFGFGPDDAVAIDRELEHMDRRFLSAFGLLFNTSIGLSAEECAAIQGIITAVHRLLRIAETRPQ